MRESRNSRKGSAGWMARAALAAAAIAAEGCAPTFKALNQPYVLTVPVDDKGCPGKPKFDVNCGAGHEDCANVRHGHSVNVESEPAGRSFGLQFDPFGASRIDVKGQLPLPIAKDAKTGTYTFTVVGQPGCPPVDPQIILN